MGFKSEKQEARRGAPGWWATPALALLLFAMILANNSELIFRSRIYEHDDYAANSLQVLKAKQFQETLGHYCRFKFHHPGPAWFYVFAWSELLLSDGLRLVPTPFNAQLVAIYGLSAFFFSAALMIVARRLPKGRSSFLGVSLLLAAWHFGAVGKFYEFIPGHMGLFCPWPPCLLVLPFFCFLVAAAAVASGSAKDLPVMTLAACFLVHGYTSMPLFVIPITILVYAALVVRSRKNEARWPWRIAPRAHWLAAATIALFLLPMIVDVVTAHPNNIERILLHLQNSHEERKSLLQSVLYFLHFGAYCAYPSSNSIPALESFDWPGTVAFFSAHWRAYSLWVLVVAAWVILSRQSRAKKQNGEADAVDFHRLRQWLGWVLLAAIGLTLVWGCMQEGPMFYYTSLSNFAIYYTILLLFALVSAQWLERHAGQWPRRAVVVARVALFVVAFAAFVREARRFRTATPDQAEQAQFAAAIEQALKVDPVEPKFLNFDWQAAGQTTRLALYLERHGHRWFVREDWPLLFGEEKIIREGKQGVPIPNLESSFWRVALHAVPPATEGDLRAKVLELTPQFDLVIHPGK
jgi:hypothetical protein